MVCVKRAVEPDGAHPGGSGAGTTNQHLEADAALLWGYVGCTYRHDTGEVFMTARVHAMPPAGVVVCDINALAIVVGAWLTRARPWVRTRGSGARTARA